MSNENMSVFPTTAEPSLAINTPAIPVVDDPVQTQIQIEQDKFRLKCNLAQNLRGGLIVEVTTAKQAKMAEESGACAVVIVEKFAADIRGQNVVMRMLEPKIIKEIKDSVTIPIIAKCRVGHYAEAQILESIGVNFIDECEWLGVTDQDYHINKILFDVPFICGVKTLAQALRRIAEGAAFLRTSGDPGSGDISVAVKQARTIKRDIEELGKMDPEQIKDYILRHKVLSELVKATIDLKRLPVTFFASGGISSIPDISLLMQLGLDGVIVGSGIFKSSKPDKRAIALVEAVKHPREFPRLVVMSKDIGEPMVGIRSDIEKREKRERDVQH